jgi:hypothetical protein
MRSGRHHGSYERHQHPLWAVALFLIAALGALAIVVGSQGAPDTGSGGTPGPDNPADCPRGTPDGFKLSDVEGKTLDEVEHWAGGRGMSVRVVMEDGRPMAVTMDYRTDRINTQVEAGVVTRYCGNY